MSSNIEKRLNEMEERIRQPSFRQPEGKANEVSYWIFDYAPQHELRVREKIACLKDKNTRENDGFIWLFMICMTWSPGICGEKNFMEKCFGLEQERGLANAAAAVQRSLKLTEPDNVIVQHLTAHTPQNSVVFLTGIGKCHPLLTAADVFYKILYHLPQTFAKIPVVLFYPGTYTGQELVLFDECQEGSYYRAFRLVR